MVGGLNALVGVLLVVAIDVADAKDDAACAEAGLHCSMARNRSKSQRRNTNSSTDRLRCGNSWANMSTALCETVDCARAKWNI